MPGDVVVAEVLAHHMGVLAFDQGVVVAAPGARPGELDARLGEQVGHPAVDVLRAVVGVQPPDAEGHLLQQAFQDGQQEALGDGFYRGHQLELGRLVDQVDQVDALDAVPVALVHRVDAREIAAAVAGPQVHNAARVAVPADEPLDLRQRQAGELRQVAADRPLVRTVEARVSERDKGVAHKLVRAPAVQRVVVNRFVAVEAGPNLIQCRHATGVESHNHSP